jgi:homoserine O-succinyltransferase
VALVNNMPDAALEDTELHFFELLDNASGDTPVFVKLYSLGDIVRTGKGQRHLNDFYFPVEDLWKRRLDGAIITGTEPRTPELRDEPYWDLLAEVFDWAAESTASSVLSCLAAHASVLHFDGVSRHRLADKQFGVFESEKKAEHPLLRNVPATRFPHSRWNELRSEELSSAGYEVLTESGEAGVDTFVKQSRKSLLVHFQGHPEYGPSTLFKEYRRDVKRFLRRERETFPTAPHGYFDATTAENLERFKRIAVENRHEDVLGEFPESVVAGIQDGWKSTAVQIYRNWVQYILSHKADKLTFAMSARNVDSRPRSTANRLS